MDLGGVSLLVALTGLMVFVIGAIVGLSAYYGSFDGGHLVRGWVLLLYGMWALLVGGVLLRLTQYGTSTLICWVILGAAGVMMLVTYHWIVAEVRKQLQID